MDDFEFDCEPFADDAAEWEAEQVFQDNEGSEDFDGEDFDGEENEGEDSWLDGSYEE